MEYLGQFPTIPLHRRGLPVTEQVPSAPRIGRRPLRRWLVLSPVLLLAILRQAGFARPGALRAERTGKRGRKFKCIKFRTMAATPKTSRPNSTT